MVQKSDDSHHPTPPGDHSGDADIDALGFEDVETSEIAAASAGGPANEELPDAASGDGVAPPDSPLLEAGTVLSERYRLVELAHSGGMGHVYKAIDLRRHSAGSDRAYVAIKTMRRSLAAKLDARITLEREAAKAQRLSHPNVVRIYDFDQHGELFYLVMEWLDGEALHALLGRSGNRPLAPQFAWRVIQGIAAGLRHAHANGVIHGDVNPANVLITDTQEIKLLDFGVARDTADAAQGAPVWAARAYASPDVLGGSPPVFEDDVFSLACIAYRLLGGVHPFEQVPADEAERAGIRPRPLPGIDPTQWDTVHRALAYSRAERPGTTDEFLPDRAAGDAADFSSRSPGIPADRWAIVGSAAVAVVAVVAAGTWFLKPEPDPGPVVDRTPPAAAVPAEPPDAAPAESAIVSALLRRAGEAFEDGRLLSPEDANARAYYRDVIAIDPGNAQALGGLRNISDVYVRQAEAAIKAGDPAAASAVLGIAADTDGGNPAIAIVNELLVAHANRQLAEAHLAAAAGDTGRARQILNEVEANGHVDVGFVDAARAQISRRAEAGEFDAQLAEAERHIAAGRLITPEDGNAQALLTSLAVDRAGDPRVLAMTERLGERLLTRAAFATAGGRITEALGLLDAVDSLGVLAPEVAMARRSVQDAAAAARQVETAEQTDAAAAALLTLFGDGSRTSGGVPAGLPVDVAAEVPDPGVQPTAPELLPTSGVDASSDAALSSAEKAATGPTRVQRATIAELGIERYVAPKFPPRAERLGQTGFVEVRFDIRADGTTGGIEIVDAEPGTVFVSSARRAVSQWRFAPREQDFTTQVRLGFDLQD